MEREDRSVVLIITFLIIFSLTSCLTSEEDSVDNQQITERQEITPPESSQLFLLEGNSCTQEVVGETTDNTPQYINLKETSDYQNDEARSLAIANVGSGVVIRIYDDPSGSIDDDWIEIITKANIVAYCINSFEESFEDDLVRVIYQPFNGLDGKVSRFEVLNSNETLPLQIPSTAEVEIILPTETTLPPIEPTAIPQRPSAAVIRIIDGDTIEIMIEGQVWRARYIGIDSPETGEPHADYAMEANQALVEGQTVYLEQDVSITDRFDRLLLYVYLADGTFVNAELVKLGAAIAKEYPPDTKYKVLLAEKQLEAETAGVGIWSISAPVPTSTSTPMLTDVPSPTQAAVPNVVIQYVFYDGDVPRVESDEYAEIKNNGPAGVNMMGWRLNAGDPGQNFYFPDIVIQPGQSCRVYTNEMHSEYCGLSFRSSQAIWNNKGDCGYLYNSDGSQVSDYCY